MNFKILFTKIKANATSIVLIGFLLLIMISPDAKAWLLQQLVAVGLFKAEIKKDGIESSSLAAPFYFTNAAGITSSTADLKGKVVFINFWASWCPPCRAEMPSIVALYQKLQHDSRFVFLFINEDDDKAKATQYLEKNNYIIPLYNRTGKVAPEIFAGTLPTTIVINKEGKIVLKHEGLAGYNTDTFIKQLEELF
jgi:thiol-disulfide isomerase/thioredoxin